jgi:hypothetical protein
MNRSALCREENYILPEKFLQSQLEEYQKSGRFIERLEIVPSNGWPDNLNDVISLLTLLQLYAGTKVEYLIMVSKGAHRRHFSVECSVGGKGQNIPGRKSAVANQ